MPDLVDSADVIDRLLSLCGVPGAGEFPLLIHRDRIIGKQAEQTPIAGSTLVHSPALTNSPRTFSPPVLEVLPRVKMLTCDIDFFDAVEDYDADDRDNDNAAAVSSSLRTRMIARDNIQATQHEHTRKRNFVCSLDL